MVSRKQSWVRDRSDALGLVYRVSEFIDKEAVEEYLQVQWPVYFLRAKERALKGQHEPLNMVSGRLVVIMVMVIWGASVMLTTTTSPIT